MLARYEGYCRKCNKPIHVGDEITWSRKGKRGVYHSPTCPIATNSAVAPYTPIYSSTNDIISVAPASEAIIDVKPETPSTNHQKEPTLNANTDLASIIASAVQSHLKLPDNKPSLDVDAIRALVADEVAKIQMPTRIEVKQLDGSVSDLGVQHKQFGLLLTILSTRTNVWLTGPTGSGKTHAAEQCAKALSLPFYFNGAIGEPYMLLGFKNALGELVRTPFREAYEGGGIYLFDEVDASNPNALLSFNAALSNGVCSFPDGVVTKHPDFICIAAANTFGLGGTNDYVGRLKQDAAFISRFAFLTWEYDEALETALTGNPTWSERVQTLRKKAHTKGIKVVISPRASYNGAKLLAAGVEQDVVEQLTIRQGMTQEQWESIQ